MESPKAKSHRTENRIVVYQDRGNREVSVKGYKLPAIRRISSEDPRYSMVIIVNNTVLYT